MPERSKLRFNKELFTNIPRACGNYFKVFRDNFSTIALGGAILTFIGVLCSIPAIAYKNKARQAQEEAAARTLEEMKSGIVSDVRKARSFKIDGLRYYLKDAHQVALQQGDNQYTLDFNTSVLTIDGPDKADRVQFFSEITDKAIIENGKAAGLKISTNFNAVLQDDLSEGEISWLQQDGDIQKEMRDFVETTRKNAEVFASQYGMPKSQALEMK